MSSNLMKDPERCSVVNYELGKLGQYIIYYFNKLKVRSKIIKNAIKKYKKDDKFHYFGTWGLEGSVYRLKFREPFDKEVSDCEFFEKNMSLSDFIKLHKDEFEIKRKVIFTCNYCYNFSEFSYSTHFVSFIYDSKRRKLTMFDPGIDCYPQGQDILVPSIVRCFKKNKLISKNKYGKSHDELGDDCQNLKYTLKQEPIGIQYNGVSKDSFCQTWTLMFLVDQIKKFDEQVQNLCRIVPENRELYLYKTFIIPFLKKDKKYLKEIINNLKDDVDHVKTTDEYIQLLDEYVNVCRVSDETSKKKQKKVKKKSEKKNSKKEQEKKKSKKEEKKKK